MLTPQRPGRPRLPRRSWPSSTSTAARSSPTARCCRRPRSPCRGTAGSTCTSRCCRPGAAPRRCSTRSCTATRSPARRRSCIEAGLDTGPVFGVVTEADPPRRHRRRPARPAGGQRRRAAGGHAWTASPTARLRRACRSRPTASRSRPKITVDDAQVDWTQPARHVDRLVRACTPAPGRLDDVPRRAAQARPGAPARRARARAGRAARSARTAVAVGTGHASTSSSAPCSRRASGRCRPPTGPAAPASSRASALADRRRGAGRAGAPADPARVVAPTTCCARSPSRTRTPTWCCRGLIAARAARPGATPRSPPSSATARCARIGTLDDDPRPLRRPRRSPTSSPPCSTCCASAPTSCCAPASRRTPRSPPPSTSPARSGTAGPAGFVNAVLRRVARPDWDGWVDELAAGGSTRSRAGACAPPTRVDRRRVRATRSAATVGETETRALAADDERPQTHLVAWPGRIEPRRAAGRTRRRRRPARTRPTRCG